MTGAKSSISRWNSSCLLVFPPLFMQLQSHSEEWNQQDGRFFWPNCGKFVFRGTRTHLQNSYFIVSVLTGKPPTFLANNAPLGVQWFVLSQQSLALCSSKFVQFCRMRTVAKMEKHAPAPHRVLGRCLLNLTSVALLQDQTKTTANEEKICHPNFQTFHVSKLRHITLKWSM